MASQSVIGGAGTISCAAPCNLILQAGAKQGYQGQLNQPWALRVYLDGQLVNWTGGQAASTDSVSLIGYASNVSAGNHSVDLQWEGSNSMVLQGINLIVTQLKK